MNARYPLLVAALCAPLVLSHCAERTDSQFEITKSSASKAELAASASYAWSSQNILTLPDKNGNAAEVAARIRTAVDQDLQTKGWTKTNRSQADLLASYAAAASQTVQSPSPDAPSSPGGDDGERPGAKQSVEGRLTIELRNRRTGKVVYRGTAEATLLDDPSPWKTQTQLQSTVTRMLGDLPARQ